MMKNNKTKKLILVFVRGNFQHYFSTTCFFLSFSAKAGANVNTWRDGTQRLECEENLIEKCNGKINGSLDLVLINELSCIVDCVSSFFFFF